MGALVARIYGVGTDAKASSISAATAHLDLTFFFSLPAITLRRVCRVMIIFVAINISDLAREEQGDLAYSQIKPYLSSSRFPVIALTLLKMMGKSSYIPETTFNTSPGSGPDSIEYKATISSIPFPDLFALN